MSSSVDQIKAKIDIVSLLSSYMKLEKAGANWKGRCPFHNEKTPSFFVSPDRGSYYCFGCQAKGDIFTFVQEFEGLDFVGSLKVLADRAGVVLEKYNKEDKSEKDMLFSVLEQAVFFYEKKLSDNPKALEYLKNRGISEETIKDFRIGFAPAEWRELFEYLLSRGVKEGEMLSVGLIKRKDGVIGQGTDSYYDTFRGRVVFPINDSSGRVVGFSGRILIPDEKSPKYLNSPETQLFNKSETLFGLDKAKKNIRLKDYSVLVEGQMDLVMMHQVGIVNAVASSGTALTEKHLVKLKRLSNRIIMAYDGDSAGFHASDRSAQIALSLGMELKVAEMPKGKDPADLAKESPEVLRESLKTAKHIIDFYTDNLVSLGLEGRELGEEIRKHVLPYVSFLESSIEKSHFIKNIAKKTFIKEEALWEDLNRLGNVGVHTPKREEILREGKRVNAIERRVIGIILWQKANKKPLVDVDIGKVEERVRSILGDKMEELLERFKKDKESLLFETESYYNDKTDLKEDLEELLLGLEEEYLKEKLSFAMVSLQKAEQGRNSQEVLKYLEICQDLSKKINSIKNFHEKK
jgi:DNA primase